MGAQNPSTESSAKIPPRLRELMRFRHFRRYFVEMEYDWLRIDFLLNCLEAAHPVVLRDLDRFDEFLLALASA